jgi:RNA polymerase sigma-70 factor (ECF subfamily)
VPTDRASAIPLAEHVRAAQAGDRDAFGRLHELFGRLLHAVLLARVPASDVPDLAQDVFLRAWLSIRGLHEPAAFGSWIATMARRQATDHLRRVRAIVPLDERLPATGGPHLSAEAAAALDCITSPFRLAFRSTLGGNPANGSSGSWPTAVRETRPQAAKVAN